VIEVETARFSIGVLVGTQSIDWGRVAEALISRL